MLKSKSFEMYTLSFFGCMKKIFEENWKGCQHVEEQKLENAHFELLGVHEETCKGGQDVDFQIKCWWFECIIAAA